MTTVERVKELCKENRIPLYKLEKELGFANGYIGQLKKGSFPSDRLQKVADYFGVTVEYLMTGETPEYYINPQTAEIAQEIFDNKGLRTLFDAVRTASPQELEAIKNMYMTMKGVYDGDDPA